MSSEISEEPTSNVLYNPVHSLKKAFSRTGTATYRSPMPSVHVLKFQEISDLLRSQTVWNILFVTKDQESSSHKFFLFKERMELGLGIFQSEFVWAVDNPDDAISLFEVVPPIRPDGFLSSHIPDIKFIVLIDEWFDIESKSGWDLIDIFPIEFFDDSSFPSIIKT